MPIEGHVPQSAVIAYRQRWWRTKIVLVTSMTTQRWVLPKGHVEDGLTPQESAAHEAEEEAGVHGIVGPEIRRHVILEKYGKALEGLYRA